MSSETAFRTVVEAGGARQLGRSGFGDRVELDLAEPAQREPAQRAVLADELRDELVGGMGEDRVRGVVLGEHAALAEDRDPVAHRDRLVDVVGDEDHRLRDLAVEPPQLLLQPGAGDRVERAERLVHQQHRRVGGERAGEPDALALAARELRPGSASRRPARGRRGRAARRSARRSAAFGQPSSRGTVAMFSPIVMCGKSPTCWIT